MRKFFSLLSCFILLLALSSCFDDKSDNSGEIKNYADTVVHADGSIIAPDKAANGVRGAGQGSGSSDVCQLNYAAGNYIVLRWSGRVVMNGSGADFVVFENSFEISGQPGHFFMDHVIVSVSRDNLSWVDFPYDYIAADETVYSDLPGDWSGFGGKTPVLYHEEDNRVDPFNQAEAGGDQFDLDDLPDSAEGIAIKLNGFKYIKLTTAPSVNNPDTGANFVKDDVICNGADIDGVYARFFYDE